MRDITFGLVFAMCAVVVMIVIVLAMVAYIAPLFGLDPNACTVVVAP